MTTGEATVSTVEQPQEVLVEAIASALPGYNMTDVEWRMAMMELRMISRAKPSVHPRVRVFIEDVARAADAMHNRLSGSPDYLGKEELDKVLGPRES